MSFVTCLSQVAFYEIFRGGKCKDSQHQIQLHCAIVLTNHLSSDALPGILKCLRIRREIEANLRRKVLFPRHSQKRTEISRAWVLSNLAKDVVNWDARSAAIVQKFAIAKGSDRGNRTSPGNVSVKIMRYSAHSMADSCFRAVRGSQLLPTCMGA